ncbi:hypothetical protein BDZ91DRAFT_802618 [Kalaharituber pfeilii]|nr:hypothetical protein BDZ91DRAFT_802618 [Kalaharituber pfeilii]
MASGLRSGLIYSILYDALDFPGKTLRRVGSKLLRGDQSRAIARSSRWEQVIVRLDLYIKEGQPPGYGTGFFLNVPGSRQDVIVTAGHNLVQPGRDGPKVTPKIGIRLIDSEIHSQVTEFVTPDAYHIASRYKSSPGPMADSADDYGVILIDRPIVNGTPRPREAFGFNIVLAAMDLTTDQPGSMLSAHVGGYPGLHQDRNLDIPPKFGFGSGHFGKYADRHLYYHGGTDQGMSGGPIWVNFLGEEIVVGIHNKHEEQPGEGNRGARLGLDVIQDICNWTGVNDGILKKTIKAHGANSKDHPEGFFIQATLQSDKPDCAESPCYAYSGPIRDPTLTTFDIIIAQTSPTYSCSVNTFYIIASSVSNGPRRFLEFHTSPNLAPEQVVLTEKPTPRTLVKLYQKGGSRRGAPADTDFNARNPFQVRVIQNHDTQTLPKSQPYPEFKLTLWSEDIPPVDDPFGLDRARLGLIIRAQRFKTKPPRDFEDFLLQ